MKGSLGINMQDYEIENYADSAIGLAGAAF